MAKRGKRQIMKDRIDSCRRDLDRCGDRLVWMAEQYEGRYPKKTEALMNFVSLMAELDAAMSRFRHREV